MSQNTARHEAVNREERTTIHYSVSGPESGLAVVFVHGWSCRRSDFDALIAQLPATWRRVSIDLAEYGDSRSDRLTYSMADFADDVAAVLDAEQIRTAILVGHSLGGSVALEMARRRPELVTRIVGLDTFHYLALYPVVADPDIAALLSAFRADHAGMVRSLIEQGSVPTSTPEFNQAMFEEMTARRGPKILAGLEGLLRWDQDESLGDVTIPIDVLAVRSLLAPEAVERYRGRIRFRPVELGGHHFAQENPAGTARALTEVILAPPQEGAQISS